MKIKKNDKVKILAGKDKGKIGKVLNVSLEKGKLTIEGLNLLVKHAKPRKQGEKGQRVQFPAALNIAKVMLVCPKCSKAIRVGRKVLEDKKKVRYCRSCKEVID